MKSKYNFSKRKSINNDESKGTQLEDFQNLENKCGCTCHDEKIKSFCCSCDCEIENFPTINQTLQIKKRKFKN